MPTYINRFRNTYMYRFPLTAFIFLVFCSGCSSELTSLDKAHQNISSEDEKVGEMQQESSKSFLGDPNDKSIELQVIVNDWSNENEPAEVETFSDLTPELIRARVNELPWDNERFSVTVALGQGSIYLPNHRILSIEANVRLDSGETQPLTAEIDEVKDGEGGRKKAVLQSTATIADLLIAYLQEDGEYLSSIEWEPVN